MQYFKEITSLQFRKISIFINKRLYVPPSFKENGALRQKRFSKHPLFTKFSLFLTVSEVVIFQINTGFLINQLKKLFYTSHLKPFLGFKKELHSPLQKPLETSTFYQIFTIFQVNTKFLVNQLNRFFYMTS